MREIPLEWYTEREREVPGPSFVVGYDFDPSDPDEVEWVRAATEQSAADRIRALEQENAALRAALARECDDCGAEPGEPCRVDCLSLVDEV
jgi:hypothetical protein